MDTDTFLITDTLRSTRRILDAVSHGMDRYTSGTVPFDRAERLVEKFSERYGVLETPAQQRARQRRKEAAVRLHMGIDGALENKRLWWVLLVSRKGGGPVVEMETLYDATDKRRRIQVMGLELLRYPRTGGPPTWTWHIPKAEFEVLKAHALALARHHSPTQAQALIDFELRRPGWRGVREQRRVLFHSMEMARQSLVARGAEPLVFPSRQMWLRMLKHDTQPVLLRELVRRHG